MWDEPRNDHAAKEQRILICDDIRFVDNTASFTGETSPTVVQELYCALDDTDFYYDEHEEEKAETHEPIWDLLADDCQASRIVRRHDGRVPKWCALIYCPARRAPPGGLQRHGGSMIIGRRLIHEFKRFSE